MSYAEATSPAAVPPEGLRQDRESVPWMVFLFLLVVPFLLSQHTWNRALERTDDINTSQEELLEEVAEGHSQRRVGFLLLAAFGIVGLVRGGGFELRFNGPLSYLVLALVAWTLASVMWTDTVGQTSRRLVVFGALCLGAVAVSKRFSLRHLSLWIFLTCLVYLLLGIVSEVGFGVFQPFGSEQRFGGTLHPNHQGVNCGLLAISGVVAAAAARRHRTLFLAGAAFGFLFLTLTQSRTSFISTCVALFVFCMLYLKPGRRLALIGAVLVIGCLILLFADVAEPVLHKAANLNRQHADTSRVPIWQDSLSYLSDRSLIGYGYQAFWTERRIDEISHSQNWGVGEAHSIYVTVLLELGLVGLGLFVLVLLGCLGGTINRYRATRDLGYALLAALLVFSILHGILESGAVLHTHQSFIMMIAVSHLAFVRLGDDTAHEGIPS